MVRGWRRWRDAATGSLRPGEDTTPAGRSRLGGGALLEPTTEWPHVEGIPLNFMAVLDVDGHRRAFGWPWPLQGGFMRDDEVHLLQLDSDGQWRFGDFGLLYFLIPADTLRAGDFSQVRVEMQCH